MIFGKDDTSSSSEEDEQVDEKGVPLVSKKNIGNEEYLMPISKLSFYMFYIFLFL